MIEAVIFDLDGVLIDSEEVWNRVRQRFVEERGGAWTPAASRAMMGMSSLEWSAFMSRELKVPMRPEEVSKAVAQEVAAQYRQESPVVDGAAGVVRRLGQRWRLGIASSANRSLIDLAVELGGMQGCFEVAVSSEETPKGKPSPDVYLEASRRLGADPGRCVAVEDSTNGILSAKAAGMAVVAVPNRVFAPDPQVLRRADAVLEELGELSVEVVEGLAVNASG